jgi:HEAT repeat protein
MATAIPRQAEPSGPAPSPGRPRRPLLFWALALGLPGAAAVGAVALARVGRPSDPRLGDLEPRLARIEEQLAGLGPRGRGGGPVFLVDPAQPAEKAQVSEAVAALSREIAELRAQVGELGGVSSRRAFELAASPEAGARRRAIRDLRELARDDPAARKELGRLLRDGDPGVRREAVDAFRRLRDPAALPDVMALFGDQEPAVRGRAARAAGDLAEQVQDPALRTKVAQGVQTLLADDKPDVRKEAAEALRELGGKEAMPGLLRALGDGSFEVQAEAVRGLARVGDPAAIGPLRQVYGDGSGANALEAAVALARLGDGGAFQKEAARLRGLVQQGGSADEKREALRLLARHNPEESRAVFEKALRDPSEAVRREAQRALERAGR